MSTQTIITNEELTRMLEESYLNLEQKLNLKPLIPVMNEEERYGLLDLIKQAQQIQEKSETEVDSAALIRLNAEYNRKMDQMVHQETAHARQEFEHLSHDQDDVALDKLEEEINNI